MLRVTELLDRIDWSTMERRPSGWIRSIDETKCPIEVALGLPAQCDKLVRRATDAGLASGHIGAILNAADGVIATSGEVRRRREARLDPDYADFLQRERDLRLRMLRRIRGARADDAEARRRAELHIGGWDATP